jgi:menaquinone-dependent protoporphyrinogen oxidase
MVVLIAYASRHRATAGIAERIAARLTADGVTAEAREARKVRDAERYDAFVVGSASYMFHWLTEAQRFVHQNLPVLAAHPVWLFSSGPLGTEAVDTKGRDACVAAEPKEWPNLLAALRPRGQRVFFGGYDPAQQPVGFGERMVRLMPAARNALAAGDFRDWAAIDAWADGIAADLVPAAQAT